MTQTEGTHAVQFSGFSFDEASGELTGPLGEGSRTQRIPPQPAKLLGHLIRRQPEIVSLDEIRDLLWPDVHVEFEKSLHTCVRKIRVALGDSASEPRFIETVPRRGYRFMVKAEGVAAPVERSLAAPRDPTPRIDHAAVPRSRPSWQVPALTAALAACLVILVWRSIGGAVPPITRVGVMPFEPFASPSALVPGNDFAEALVHQLVSQDEPTLDVIGPTTTQNYPEHTGALTNWIESDGIDYVINGREAVHDGAPRVLLEIIRGHDGAHVWVRYMDELPQGEERFRSIADALALEIAHPRQRRQ